VLATLLGHLAELVPDDSANVMLLEGEARLSLRARRGYERGADPARPPAIGSVVGLFSLDKAEAGFFTEEHRGLAESLARHAACSVQNARLYARERAAGFYDPITGEGDSGDPARLLHRTLVL